MIQGVAEVRDAYRDSAVASAYVEERFREPLGALLHKRQADAVRSVIERLQPEQVLEIAPGPARVTVDVAPLLTTPPVLLDSSRQMLAQAKRRLAAVSCAATVMEGDAFDLPFSSRFDLVYTFRLIRHFEESDRRRLYRQIARALKPGGTLVFDAVNEVVSRPLREQSGPDAHRHYDALLTAADVRRELEEEGFEDVRLLGVQHRYSLLLKTQILLAPRSRRLARAVMEVIDRFGGEPLEWVVTCRRK